MRVEASATTVTWLPFEALDRIPAVPLELAVAHYDDPPPPVLAELDELRRHDVFREANELRAWVEVVDGQIVDHGQAGDGFVGGSGVDLGDRQVSFAAVEFPAILPEPEVGDGWVRFVQTVGGRIGLPAPRPLSGKPYFHIGAVSAWTTLELVLRADGSSEARLAAASPFPRHSLYDDARQLVAESGSARLGFGEYSPWDEEAPAFASAVASELERRLATTILRDGGKLVRRRVLSGDALVEQGRPGEDLYVLLDGLLEVEIDGETVAQVGPGAVLGERALLGDGHRTATLRAVRAARVAVISGDRVRKPDLRELSALRLR